MLTNFDLKNPNSELKIKKLTSFEVKNQIFVKKMDCLATMNELPESRGDILLMDSELLVGWLEPGLHTMQGVEVLLVAHFQLLLLLQTRTDEFQRRAVTQVQVVAEVRDVRVGHHRHHLPNNMDQVSKDYNNTNNSKRNQMRFNS